MAGEIAGYNVRQVINEPTAAAIAYGTVESKEKRVVLVYDLGGGTFDVTMIDIQPDSIEVICTGGDHNLGGKDWDDRIVSYLVEQFQTQTGSDEDILEDPDTWQDLQLAAERSKKILSQRDKTPVSITHGGERVKVELRRDKFEELTRDLMERTVVLTHEMISEAKKKGYHRFDEIILVGGSTRIPMCSRRIREEFKTEPKIFDPDEAVAKGAAIYGWKLSLNDSLIRRIAEKTHQKIEQIAQVEDIRTSAPEHIVKEVTRQLAEETGYTLPALERSMVRIKNVASKSFGIIVLDPHGKERVFNLILRNTPVPANVTKDFFTAIENQKSVLIRIMENESSDLSILPDQAVEIGTAVLTLPPNLPKDLAVRISFRLNEEGRLQMSAVETAEQRSVEVMIETTSIIGGEELAEAKRRAQALVVH
jgi:molecular chaperone DnaK (HSP70)